MNLIATILTVLVGIEHLGIMGLEMFASPRTQAQSFDLDAEFTRQAPVRVLLANQGIYNGMLGLSLIASCFLFAGSTRLAVQLMLLVFVVVVALFGGWTATKKIWLLQLLPALLAAVAVALAI